jgi:hypothetical protein
MCSRKIDVNKRRVTSKILAMAVALPMAAIGSPCATAASPAPQIWFAPDNDTSDYLDLFRKPETWRSARSHISVLKVGPQQAGGPNRTGKNTLAQLREAGAFRQLAAWGIALAIEVPAIKPWDCTGRIAVQRTLDLIENVRKAGGKVEFVSMDEPLASGIRFCKDTLEGSAVKTAEYMKQVAAKEPHVQIGDTEAYPYFSIGELKSWLAALQKNGVTPAYVHLDANIHRIDKSPHLDLAADLRGLQNYLSSKRIPFGIIMWSGYNPAPSDKAYFDRTLLWIKRVRDAIGAPDQIIFQSWVIRSAPRCKDTDVSCDPDKLRCMPEDPPGCGEQTVPNNLPENDPASFSHTRLINEGLAMLGHR